MFGFRSLGFFMEGISIHGEQNVSTLISFKCPLWNILPLTAWKTEEQQLEFKIFVFCFARTQGPEEKPAPC